MNIHATFIDHNSIIIRKVGVLCATAVYIIIRAKKTDRCYLPFPAMTITVLPHKSSCI